MKITMHMSNSELDAVAAEVDAQQGERMLAAVHEFIGRFVAYPSAHAQVAHALWIAHTHLMEKWDSTPRLAFLSPEPNSGKTRALEVSELLVPSPVVAVNVSPAYLFRKVGSDEGVTILFDEIDTVFGPKAKENEEIRGLLNAGHRRGAVAGRCVMNGKTVVTEEISAYAAVALAGLGWLPDTILSRSVIIRMRRRRPDEQVEQFRRRIHVLDGERVRNMIEAWAGTVTGEITWPKLPPGIEDRDADVWESLIAVADLVGGHKWPTLASKAAVVLVAACKQVDNKSLGIRLLADLMVIFGERTQMTTKEILAALHALDEAPWNTINKGQPLDDRKLSTQLRQYEIRSDNLVVGIQRPKGYKRADFQDAWLRYLSPSPAKSATNATNAIEPENRALSSVAQALPVADAVAEGADVLPLPLPKNASKSADVADVAEVADLAGKGDGGLDLCDQCGQPGTDADPVLDVSGGGPMVHLHRGCIEDWKYADMPPHLRRPAP